MNLALFDFDGTLIEKDSLGEFIKYAVGEKRYIVGMIKFSPFFIAYKLKLMKNYVAKEILFREFFRDYDEQKFKTIANEFSLNELDKYIKKDIYAKFLKHIEDGDRVVIVSASMRCWLEAWSKKHNVELLSTQLEFIDGKFSGRFLTKNCHGIEKVNRIKEHLSLDDYENIYAYGDSSGDDEMLALANYAFRV